MNDDVGFSCTSCGKCCHDLKLPLSISEAVDWLERGGEVGVICDLMPWVDEPPLTDMVALRKKSLSFEATSGQLKVRVTPILVAQYEGPCPHLLSDFRCGQYESRPLACKIYPAELNPLQVFDPNSKLCPSDAWQAEIFIPLINQEVHLAIETMNKLSVLEVNAKANLCRIMNINSAALSNQGYVLHQPDRTTFQKALTEINDMIQSGTLPESSADWCVLTHLDVTAADLKSVGVVFEQIQLENLSKTVSIPNGIYIGFGG